MQKPRLSIVTPAFNEAENLPVFMERLQKTQLAIDWEWIIVDDHSRDSTFAVASDLAERDARVRVFRLSRNSGSHAALVCGLERAQGDACAVMAADLQDPPELLPDMIGRWLNDAQVVWAVRSQRLGEAAHKLLFSKIYHRVMQSVLGHEAIPLTGADFFLIDRVVVNAVLQFPERNTSIIALLAWMGFRQECLTYVKQARLHGQSGWTFKKCLKLAKDSVTSFTAVPLRFTCCAGLLIAITGALYAIEVVVNSFMGHPIQGWSSLMIVVLVLGGFQLVMLGVMGEYLWSALDEVRRRPRFLVEASTDLKPEPWKTRLSTSESTESWLNESQLTQTPRS